MTESGLVALMPEGGRVENVGCSLESGREQLPSERGWLHAAVFGHPEWPAELQHESARIERTRFEDEPIRLGFTTRRGREVLEQLPRIEARDGGIARLRGDAFCPETMRAAGEVPDLSACSGLYRHPAPAPGKNWREAR